MTLSPRSSQLLSGVLGGLVVLVVGSVLIATGAIGSGKTVREIVRQAPITRPAADQRPRGAGLTVGDVYDRDAPGVVFIQADVVEQNLSPFGFGPQQGTATGSGFVLDKRGYVLTNAHVVENARKITVQFGEQDQVGAKLVGRDPSTDLAVLKVNVDSSKLKPLTLGDSSSARVGDPVVAIGNPFGLDRTVTTGIVSALQRQIQAPNGFQISNVIQTDASINPGNSGGPLIDATGRVIGLTSQIATGGSRGSVGVGFAVPINTAKRVVPQLEKGGKIQRAFLGVTTAPVTKQRADDLNLPTDKGALVQDVVSGGPADKAGIRAGDTRTTDGFVIGGDLIFKVAGRAVAKPQDIAAAIDQKKPGDEVQVELYRGGEKKTVTVKLSQRPATVSQSSDEGSGQAPNPGDLLPFP
jgi:S1-C subfamily serine protease